MLAFPVWAEDDLKPADFAGAMVYSGREGGLLVLEIPMDVYRGIRRADLGDIRIFDASQAPVPFGIRERPRELFTPAPADIPFFAWDGGEENMLPANTDIEITTSGAVVRIENQRAASTSPPVFLADFSALPYLPSTLKVTIDNQGNNFNTPVSIHYSGDLSNWRAFNRRQALSSFGTNVQDNLDLPDSQGWRYLLITFHRQAPAPLGMTAFFREQERAGEYHEMIFKGIRSPDSKRVHYNTGAYYPARYINFVLEDADSIQVLVKNRFRESDEWTVQTRAALFRYNSASTGGVVINEPFELGGINSRAPFWELEAAGELPFSSAPDILLRWEKQQLIFPARGQGPWTLAFGNADCPPLGSSELLLLSGREEPEAALFTGQMRYEEAPLSVPPREKEHDYRTLLLWVFLGTAVLGLTVLAFYIAKSMNK